jgi:hypothetical protein
LNKILDQSKNCLKKCSEVKSEEQIIGILGEMPEKISFIQKKLSEFSPFV